MSHLWEGGFLDTEEGLKLWSTQILDNIPNGDRRDSLDAYPLLDFSTGSQRPFQFLRQGEENWTGIREGNRVMAIIVTPTLDGHVRYRPKVDELFRKVKEWIPGCETRLATYRQERGGTAEDIVERQKTSAEGKVLFQTDPRSHVMPYWDGNGTECQRWKSRLRVYVGGNQFPVYDDEWSMPTTGKYAQLEQVPQPVGPPQLGLVLEETSDETLSCRNLSGCSPTCLECPPPADAPSSPLQPLIPGNVSLVRRTLADPVSLDATASALFAERSCLSLLGSC